MEDIKNRGEVDESVGDGVDWLKYPRNKLLSDDELKEFCKDMSNLPKGKVPLYLKCGLHKKIRLEELYQHDNSKDYNGKGTKCTLCSGVWKLTKRNTTTKGCNICQVPLCSWNNSKFKRYEDSCEYIWHHTADLTNMSRPKWNNRSSSTRKRGRNIVEPPVVLRRSKRKRRR
jgi:hypothetical protein